MEKARERLKNILERATDEQVWLLLRLAKRSFDKKSPEAVIRFR